jgi:hypothetical protein
MPMNFAQKLPANSPATKVSFKYQDIQKGYMVNKGGKVYFYKLIPESYKKKFPKFKNNKYWILQGFYLSVGLRKLNVELSANGKTMFVPRAYTQKTKRKTFRGLTFKQISKIQKTY